MSRLSLLITSTLILPVPAGARSQPVSLIACSSALSRAGQMSWARQKLIWNLSRYHVGERRAFTGHDLHCTGAGRVKPRRIVLERIAPILTEPMPWRHDGREFWLYNVGFRPLEADAALLNQTTLAAIRRHPGRHLRLVCSPDRRRDLAALDRFRWATLDKVLDHYRTSMPDRLDEAELHLLRLVSEANANADVLAVFDERLPWTATREQIVAHLRATIQISYHQVREFRRPSLDGLMAAADEPNQDPQRTLPMVFGLNPLAGLALTDEVGEAYGRDEVCEFTRFANFGGLPKAARDRLLSAAYDLAEARGCTTFLAAADAPRAVLYRRYGFSEARPLGTVHDDRLLHLRVSDPATARARAALLRPGH